MRWSLLFLRSGSKTESSFSLWLPLFTDIHYLFVCLKWVEGFSLANPRSVSHTHTLVHIRMHIFSAFIRAFTLHMLGDKCVAGSVRSSSAQWPLAASTPHTNWICAANGSCVKHECMNAWMDQKCTLNAMQSPLHKNTSAKCMNTVNV